jgi:hypothetical protein
MDWLWVYATIARNVGWTYRKIGKQPACDIFALLDDIAERPPSYIIDGIRHLKPKPKKLRMPDKVRALLAWADELGAPKT